MPKIMSYFSAGAFLLALDAVSSLTCHISQGNVLALERRTKKAIFEVQNNAVRYLVHPFLRLLLPHWRILWQ